ncbi:hypothetical protein QJS04_geneDACA001337 [Acorus gramineus]|uniref:Uncharacterized protein n=1 Tax=Acorus gramineus TaxID=55184 RepID=A0AAV9AE72_ACOGR|nr:hypothetical protein QJS04_geneDACA001337 [Acorus gramineus]
MLRLLQKLMRAFGLINRSSVAKRGHFVVYTSDGRRFVVPLVYLKSTIFRELFRLSEFVFGYPDSGPIKLVCDGVFMEYACSLISKSIFH